VTYSVAIFQAYVPEYREPFFNGLIHSLAEQGISCEVYAGLPEGDQARRGDAVQMPWMRVHQPRYIPTGIKRVPYYGALRAAKGYNAVVLGLEGTSPDVYEILLRHRTPRLGLWGHVGSYVKSPNTLDRSLEAWAMRRADHVFAYTPGGATCAINAGVPPSRVTTVMNTVDTQALQIALAELTQKDRVSFAQTHDLTSRKTLAFVGGLDASKRVSFLAKALDLLWRADPEVRLLLGGDGVDAHLLDRAITRRQVVRLGYCGPFEKALMAATASLIVMPGRIGLVAVDALAMGLPVVTTTWPFHGPEMEYLSEGITRFTVADDPSSFADEVLTLLEPTSRPEQRENDFRYPQMTDMVDNFVAGVERMLA
jgi:glycosyltransferase involved in cell wall biosynthesis